jgi:hypothetical protein
MYNATRLWINHLKRNILQGTLAWVIFDMFDQTNSSKRLLNHLKYFRFWFLLRRYFQIFGTFAYLAKFHSFIPYILVNLQFSSMYSQNPLNIILSNTQIQFHSAYFQYILSLFPHVPRRHPKIVLKNFLQKLGVLFKAKQCKKKATLCQKWI